MKICHLTSHYLPDPVGLTTVVRELAREEMAQGHRVTVVSFYPLYSAERVAWEVIEGVGVARVDAYPRRYRTPLGMLLDRFLSPRQVAARLRELAPDVLHVCGITALAWGAFLYSRRQGVPLVVSLYGNEFVAYQGRSRLGLITRWRRQLSLRRLRSLFAAASAVTASGRSLIAAAASLKLGADLRFIPNGVDADYLDLSLNERRSELAVRWNLKPDDPILVTVQGLWHESKGARLLLDGFGLVCRQRPKAQLVVVGDGPLRPQLEAQAQRQGIADQVRFLGALPYEELFSVYALADVYVQVPLYEEGVSQTALEAQGMGKPVVISRCGAMLDSMLDGETGYLVDIDDPQGLAHRVLELLDNPARREEMGRRGREWVLENFSYQAIARQYLEVFAARGQRQGKGGLP